MIYTVIALYDDGNSYEPQPYSAKVEANSPAEAVAEAQTMCREDNRFDDVEDPLVIAGVIEGEHKVL